MARAESVPVYCPERGCKGRMVSERPHPGLPVVPLCATCGTVYEAARERVARLLADLELTR